MALIETGPLCRRRRQLEAVAEAGAGAAAEAGAEAEAEAETEADEAGRVRDRMMARSIRDIRRRSTTTNNVERGSRDDGARARPQL